MLSKSKNEPAPRMQRLTRNKGFRLLFFLMLLVLIADELKMFLRVRPQGQPFFHSTLETVSVVALILVMLFAIVVKSRRGQP